MSSKGRSIVVIGTSAGGLEVLDQLIRQLPSELPAAIFIVQHMAPENSGGALLHGLGKHKAFACKLASDGETFEKGADIHRSSRLPSAGKTKNLLVTKGARENRYRPAIDPLFRKANRHNSRTSDLAR
jgi:two-component system chemotaxis response regulator CheB